MKKILFASLACTILASTAMAQLGKRYDRVPGGTNKYAIPHKEYSAPAYATPTTITPTSEDNIYNFAQLTGALTLNAAETKAYTGDRMYLLFNADGTDRVVTFNTGYSSQGTLTVPASTYVSVFFVYNGDAWQEISRRTAPVGTFSDGTVSAPGISFTSDPDNGLYRIGANNVGFAAGGSKIVDFATTGITITGQTTNGAGTVTAPGNVTGGNDNGWYEVSSTQQGMSIANTLVGGWNSAGLFTSTITEQVSGSGVTFSKQTIQHRTATTYTAVATATAAEVAKGLLAWTGGADNLTLPTATALGTQLSAVAGTTFDFVVDNSGGSGTVTLVVGAGMTAVSALTGGTTLTLAQSTTAGTSTYRLTFISATVCTISRIS